MSRIMRRRPSPSMIVAGAALVVALAGTAIAGPLATKSAFNDAEERQVKKLARGEIEKAAPSSAFNQNGEIIHPVPGTYVDVATTTITTQKRSRILATGSVELLGADSDESGICKIQIDGTDSEDYGSAPDDIGTDNRTVIAVNFAVTRPAGTYTASLQCLAIGTVSKADAAISVYGLGA